MQQFNKDDSKRQEIVNLRKRQRVLVLGGQVLGLVLVLWLGLVLGQVLGQVLVLVLGQVLGQVLRQVLVLVLRQVLGRTKQQSLVEIRRQSHIKGWLAKILPEEWRGELEALRRRWLAKKRHKVLVDFMTGIWLLGMLKAYLQIKVENVWLLRRRPR